MKARGDHNKIYFARVCSHSIEGTSAILEINYSDLLLGRIDEVAFEHAKFYINRIWGQTYLHHHLCYLGATQ